MVCGLWFVVCGLWFVVCGLWFVVCGLWFVVCVVLLTHGDAIQKYNRKFQVLPQTPVLPRASVRPHQTMTVPFKILFKKTKVLVTK